MNVVPSCSGSSSPKKNDNFYSKFSATYRSDRYM